MKSFYETLKSKEADLQDYLDLHRRPETSGPVHWAALQPGTPAFQSRLHPTRRVRCPLSLSLEVSCLLVRDQGAFQFAVNTHDERFNVQFQSRLT
jgi:hypothetical protein